VGRGNRWRLTLLFAALLLACSAAPVIADSSTQLEEQAPGDPERFFDGDRVIPVDLANIEREEREREEWLASPEATEEREQSWLAYGDSSPGESEELLKTAFSSQLEMLNGDSARVLSDADLIREQDETAATVSDEGERYLLDSALPVRAEDDEGDMAKVDLSLASSPEGFETENAISDVVAPLFADEPTEVGDQGFAISQAEAEDSTARRFGDMNLFYPDVLPDTDLMVSPTGTGVEVFDLLRSKESPEDFRFVVDLPSGSVLRPGEWGGAEVVRNGETLIRVAPPFATDAQGTDVPVKMSIVQNEIVLHVAHREADYADPILLDPPIEDWANVGNNWYEGKHLEALTNGAWKYKSNNSQIGHDVCCYEGKYTGLLTYTKANVFYGSEQYGQWSYSTPNYATFVTHAWVTPFWRNVESCGGSEQPHDYVGILSEPNEVWNPLLPDKAKTGTVSLDGKGQGFIIGLGSGPPGVWISCNRYLYAGGVALWLNDDWPPALSVTGIPPSSEWASDLKPINLVVNANDNGTGANDDGFGIDYITINPEGASVIKDDPGCSGLYGSICPTVRTWQKTFTGDSMRQGIRDLGVTAADPTGKIVEQHYTTKVDNDLPEVALSGQLAQATGEVVSYGEGEQPVSQGEDQLSLPVYKLDIKAKDGSRASSLTKRSGVKSIKIFLDKKEVAVPWTQNSSCPETSCEMNVTYTLPVSTIGTGGSHELEIRTEDFVGHVQPRTIEFEYFPATGMKDAYVMHYFPLPNGQGDEEEELHPVRPELAVNVMNGNLVYRERDIDISGTAGVDLEVERFYNSMLPTAENTEWGDGWTLAETPELDPISSSQADVVESSGALEDKVALPTEVGATKFDPVLQATIEKKSSGGYEMTDETGESSTSVSFDSTGQAEALPSDSYAKVDYSYESGDLAEIEVEDPATFAGKPEIPDPQLVTVPIFGSSFGTNGSGNGQFKAPADVAVDKQANLWVADRTNSRLEEFNEAGEFVRAVGALGTAGGKLSAPAGISIDGSGNVWVADTANNRVEQFNQKGEFVLAFGKDVNKTKVTAGALESERNVCTAASGNTCQAGVAGSTAGQLKSPQGIAATSGGNVWVADTGNSRLQKFSPTGGLINNISGYGSEPGKLREPASIAMGPDGSIWVADTVNNRIQQWSSSLALVRTFGTEGTGNGQFKRPAGIDVDASGNVWVADQLNNRLQQFDPNAQFVAGYGSSGSGNGQFNFSSTLGIAADSKGHLWVADSGNNRVQAWLLPVEKPTYLSTFGSVGSADGQLKAPAGIALGLGGALWVADKGNNRIEKFDSSGKYLAKFGSLGTGDGQFNRPAAIDVDRDGNLLVTDSSNNRIQKFDPSGQFISKFGSAGTGNGQFATPEGIATDFKGNIWVADTDNGRLQKFDEEGRFLKVVGSKGSGTGQLGEPTALDIDPEGNVWVADWLNNRISAFSPEGTFLGSFGSAGSGPGQFNHPDEIEIDSHGNVWVGDQTNNRVQRFNLKGEYVGQFGTSGSGEGNLSLAFPMGITTDSLGHIWVTDPNNNRIQKWMLGNYRLQAPALDLSDGDPKVMVETPSGLVSNVSGNAAGVHTYAHVGDDLTAHKGPEGETKYVYDGSGRMTKVTMANGTWAEIGYESTYGRVKEVTVSVEGATPKTTRFSYKDTSPRRTTVEVPGAPNLTYDIGDDGSVLKWWNTQKPPTLNLGGSLYDFREKTGELSAGSHLLEAVAESAEGIASIRVLENGNTVVSEKTCDQVYGNEVTECIKDTDEWVTETDLHPPGHLDLEVIATDTDGESASERFWVDIPQPPPPPALGTPVPPKFNEILQFREEYGLEKVFPVSSETELNERIFNLIKAWYEPGTPAGQVARASWERWGIPMRPEDVAEMEYREWYVHEDLPKIEDWAEAHRPETYAGYYVDHPAGGVLRVGFTSDQAGALAELKAQASLVAQDRLAVFTSIPNSSLASLRSTLAGAEAAWDTDPALLTAMVSAGVDESTDSVEITGTDLGILESHLEAALGPQAPLRYVFEDEGTEYAGRNHSAGRIHAGDRIIGKGPDGYPECTAGFGAWDRVGTKDNGDPEIAPFVLTAGHCAPVGRPFYREDSGRPANPAEFKPIGHSARTGFDTTREFMTDGSAILLNGGGLMPYYIYRNDEDLKPAGPAGTTRPGERLCFSGFGTNERRCGKVIGVRRRLKQKGVNTAKRLFIIVRFAGNPGDSGAPVWSSRTGESVGLLSGGPNGTELVKDWVTPLLRPPRFDAERVPGILHAPGMKTLHLAVR
jgi:tripartite motif-containing protein 71